MKFPQVSDQTDRVYEAEGFMMWLPIYAEQMTLDEIKEFLANIFQTRWLYSHFYPGDCRFFVHDGRGARQAIGKCDLDTGEIHLTYPRGSRHKLMVLHELAHAVGGGGHDGWFCSAYLKLVRRFMGKDAWEELRWQFQCAGVKFRRPPCPRECDELGTPRR